MTDRLRWLIWAAALIAGLVGILDMRDRLASLLEERIALERRQQRELDAVSGIDWTSEADRAQQVQARWVQRWSESVNPSVTRVQLMERLGKLCEASRLQCQISPVDEGGTARPGAAAADAGGAADDRTRNDAAQGKNAKQNALPGLEIYVYRIGVTFTPETLLALLQHLESGEQLYAVQGLTVRGNRLDLKVATYALDASAGLALRRRAAASTAGARQ